MPEDVLVRCLVCAELLSYDREQTEPLIAHLQDKHPYIHVARSADILLNSDLNLASHDSESDKRAELGNEYGEKKRLLKGKKIRRNVNFRPGKVFCPVCKKLEVPIIRRQKNFSRSEGIPACFMLGCWPLCFLPYFVRNSHTFDVYCRNCSFFVGRYNKKSNILMSRPVARPSLSKIATKQQDCVENIMAAIK